MRYSWELDGSLSLAFDNCQSLFEMTVSKKNRYYYVSDNTLYTAEGNVVTGW